MQEGLTRLNSAREVVTALPFSAVTVVLLTAAWSFESNAAREAVLEAQQLADCSSFKVSYYELSVPISQVHAKAIPDPPRTLASLFRNGVWRKAIAARNVTASIPWFPCVRIFRGGREPVIPSTHVDSFTPAQIAAHIEEQCRLCHQDMQEQIASEELRPVVDPFPPAQSPLSRLHRFVTPISRDRFGREMTKSVFPSLGALFMLRGGVAEIFRLHQDAWDVVAEAVSVINVRKHEAQDISRRWVASIADTSVDRDLAERNGLSPNAPPTLLLLDPSRDASELVFLEVGTPVEQIAHVLLRFEHSSGGQNHRLRGIRDSGGSRPGVKERILTYWRRPLPWRKLFSTECELCLKNFLDVNFENCCAAKSSVWLIVHQPWCGFSQRILGTYRTMDTLFRQAGLDSHVIEVTDTRELPDFLDEMVDGFPTVIRLHSDEIEETVDEFAGPHSVESILTSTLEEDSVRIGKLGFNKSQAETG